MADQPTPDNEDEELFPSDVTTRIRRVGTLERLAPEQRDEWVTGEFRIAVPTVEEEAYSQVLRGLPASEPEVAPLIEPHSVRPQSGLEQGVRLAFAGLLALTVLVFFGQAVIQMSRDGKVSWLSAPVEVVSEPAGAQVTINERVVGTTPVATTEFCRGTLVNVRVSAKGHASWSWDGRCPADAPLKLNAQLRSVH